MKNNMKKIVCFFIMILICLSLSSCGYYSKFTKFYKKSTLESLSLEGLPKPDYKFVSKTSFSRDLYGIISEEDFNSYALKVYDFLNSRYDYVETYDNTDSYFVSGKSNGYEIISIDDDISNCISYEYNKEELISTCYNFVYFNEEDLLKDYIPNCIILTYYHTNQYLNRTDFEKGGYYNFIIDLPKGTIRYDVYLFDISIDDIRSSYELEKFMKGPKYPFYLINDEVKNYDKLIASSLNKEEIDENVYNLEYEEGYVVESYKIILENELYYGVEVSLKKNDDSKTLKLLSFKKDKLDYNNNQMITDDDDEIRKLMSIVLYFEIKEDNSKITSTSFYDHPEVVTFTVEKIVFDNESEKNLKYIEIEYDIYLNNNEIVKRSEYIRYEQEYIPEG